MHQRRLRALGRPRESSGALPRLRLWSGMFDCLWSVPVAHVRLRGGAGCRCSSSALGALALVVFLFGDSMACRFQDGTRALVRGGARARGVPLRRLDGAQVPGWHARTRTRALVREARLCAWDVRVPRLIRPVGTRARSRASLCALLRFSVSRGHARAALARFVFWLRGTRWRMRSPGGSAVQPLSTRPGSQASPPCYQTRPRPATYGSPIRLLLYHRTLRVE